MNTQAQTDNLCLALTTLPDLAQAEKLAEQLVEMQLAACVSILPNVSSVYRWDGKTVNSQEVQLVIKTHTQLVSKIDKYFAENHSYDLPELISCNIDGGSASYLQWLNSNLEIS